MLLLIANAIIFSIWCLRVVKTWGDGKKIMVDSDDYRWPLDSRLWHCSDWKSTLHVTVTSIFTWPFLTRNLRLLDPFPSGADVPRFMYCIPVSKLFTAVQHTASTEIVKKSCSASVVLGVKPEVHILSDVEADRIRFVSATDLMPWLTILPILLLNGTRLSASIFKYLRRCLSLQLEHLCLPWHS